MRGRIVLAALAPLALIIACAPTETIVGGSEPFTLPNGSGVAFTSDPSISVVATATGSDVDVFRSPGDPVPITSLANPNENGAPRVFLAISHRDDWLEVLLPVRPNGSRGWIRKGDVTLAAHNYRVRVDVTNHRLVVWKGMQPILQEAVGVGRSRLPTPTGVYYLTELLKTPDPNGRYGPYAFGISGYSDILTSFRGGDAGVGIHGTNDPSSIGGNTTHGCIRLNNHAITRLAHLLPLGTPVFIKE
jgi:lipoprotein-anchoring transpeptidase ErfK/SrfK